MMERKGMPMMGTMRKMMGDTGDFNPMKMCKTMISTMGKVSEMSFYGTPEIRTMFEEWIDSIESEIYKFISDKKEIRPAEIATQFKISESAARFFLNHLAAKGKIKANFAEDVKAESKEETIKNPKSDTKGCKC